MMGLQLLCLRALLIDLPPLQVVMEYEGVVVEDTSDLHTKAWLQVAQEEHRPAPLQFLLKRAEGMKNDQVYTRPPAALTARHCDLNRTLGSSRRFSLPCHKGLSIAAAGVKARARCFASEIFLSLEEFSSTQVLYFSADRAQTCSKSQALSFVVQALTCLRHPRW